MVFLTSPGPKSDDRALHTFYVRPGEPDPAVLGWEVGTAGLQPFLKYYPAELTNPRLVGVHPL